MKLKRLLALICALTFLVSPAAYAAEPYKLISTLGVATTDAMLPTEPATTEAHMPVLSEEEALKIAIDTFAIPESYGKPNSQFWQNEETGTANWTFNWSPETHPDLSAKFYLNVVVNAYDGTILSYSWSEQFYSGETREAKFDRESARPIAQKWLEKLVPEAKRANLKLVETGFETADQLYFTWARLVNGIPYYNDTVNINIDSVTGNLLFYYFYWDEKLEFPAASAAISLDQALETWKQMGAELLYQDFYHRFLGSEARLIYRPKQEGLMIDAMTGKLIEWNGDEWSGEAKPVPIPAPSTAVVKPEQPLTQEEALALVRQTLGGDTLKQPDSYYYNERFAGKFESQAKIAVWNFSWYNSEKQTYTNVGVDATHGFICDLYTGQNYWEPDEAFKDKQPIDEIDARQRAIELFVKIRPDLVGQVQLLDTPVTEKYLSPDYVQREYSFNFVRLVDGIRYPTNYVTLVIDRFSGELRNIYSNWTYGQLPEAKDLITEEQALALMLEEAPLELVYTTIYPESTTGTTQPIIKLVYRINYTYGSSMIDAKNGHFLDYDGRDLTELRKGISDIADHEAKNEIESAVQQGLFETTDGKFNPLGTVTKGELAKVLVMAFDRGMMYGYLLKAEESGVPSAPSYTDVAMDHEYAPYIHAALQMGIFKPTQPNSQFEPDAEATKEEAALYLVRAMGYSFIDGFAATIDSGYTDQDEIAESYRNAVGLLVGLKVLAKGGEFKPQTAITRADLAKMVVTAIKIQYPDGYYPYYYPYYSSSYAR